MTVSMTGFTALEAPIENGTIMLELRAVNSRYLDLHFKLDDTFKSLEPAIREALKAQLSRGKLECKMSYASKSSTPESLQLNQHVVDGLLNLSQQVQKSFPKSADLTVAEILQWPNALMQTGVSKEKLFDAGMSIVAQGIEDLNAARTREGEKLKANILERIDQIEALVEKVKPLMGALVKAYQEKLEKKLQETIKTLDADRITQELVIYAQRIDVDEELVRLSTHVSEIKRILSQDKPAGKRLDFMMQELNREANTLGSKSVSVETTQVSMELKVLIEQMREQIQNIE